MCDSFQGCVFDIETSGLDAIGSGTLLCAVIRPINLNSKAVILRADDLHCSPGHEKRLVQAVVDELSKYKVWVGHNIIRFDWPWLKSRCKYFDLSIPLGGLAYDTMDGFRRLGYKSVPNHFGKPSKSLAHVVDFFGFDQEKTSIFPRAHWETVWGNMSERKRAMDNLVSHCVADVNMTAKIFYAMIDDDHRATFKRLL